MRFGAPHLLWLALLAPLAALAAAAAWRRRLRAGAAWAARGLWDRLLPGYRPWRLALAVGCVALAVLGIALALARPRWGGGQEKVERRGVDVVFLVDSSLSMAAPDVAPSRLFAAKALVQRMSQAMPGNRVALVQTEGEGLMLAPLTLDGAVLDLLLDTIEPGSLPRPGTELAAGLDTALRLFGPQSEKHRALVLLSDGEDHGGGLDAAAARIKDAGVVVFALGIGTPEGSPIPLGGSDYKRNDQGQVVITRLHEENLEPLARDSGGSYLRVTSAATDPGPILRRIDRLEKRSLESETVTASEERFQWPLLLAALALIVQLAVGPFASGGGAAPAVASRREPRSWLAASTPAAPSPAGAPVPSAPAAARMAPPPPGARPGARPLVVAWPVMALWLFAHAAALPSLESLRSAMSLWPPHLPAWAERWLWNPRERTAAAIEATRRGDPKGAVAPADTAGRLAPDSPEALFNAGSAHLAAGDAAGAAPLLDRAARAAGPHLAGPASYNLGNARFDSRDFAGAVEAYKQALRAAPRDAAAKFNLELALRALQRQSQGSSRGAGPRGGGQRPRQGDARQSPGQTGGGAQGEMPQQGQPAQSGQGQRPAERQGQSGSPQGAPRSTGGQPQMQPGQQLLPGYRDQPEMSAAEAAAVLESVENLERQQRRQAAGRQIRQRAANGEDW
jgi:Ca-activated chloride channel family protein